ncbi:hypothetical protein SAJA_12645 [Salinisphaera japonica YTM-1]|uniref:Uncharacterized protein n=1 Tax=Salinisphaera japonica YTM-1 TaxID=1209778 RepID=A0A423PJ91_9GAMM|nr:hypothetical protein SAJA_12645 [Salinisphaera japonica YTM-1]
MVADMIRTNARRLALPAPTPWDTLKAAGAHDPGHPIAADCLAFELQDFGDPPNAEYTVTTAMQRMNLFNQPASSTRPNTG